MGSNFLPSDQKTKEVNMHERAEATTYDEQLAKGVDTYAQKILANEFSTFALQSIGKGRVKDMTLRERKTILDSLKFRKDSFQIEPNQWGYNWRHFENKVMSVEEI